MSDLLTLGWPWFGSALGLGVLVGFFTFAQDENAGPPWRVILCLVALAMGLAISFAGILEGRDAIFFDIAYLAFAAYAAGLPLGGAVKALAGARRPAPAEVTPEPAPLIATLESGSEIDAPLAEAAPLEATLPAASLVPEPPAPAIKPRPGTAPEMLAGPRGGAPDNLARIKGIGPKSLEKLNALGVFHYDQIAAWNLENAKWIGAAIGAPGRVERDKWIQQARILASAEAERQ